MNRTRADGLGADGFGAGEPAPTGLVLAPPGSGKTTFLSHLATTAPERVAWYRVGAEDDDELALTRHLGHTLGAALGIPGMVDSVANGRVTDLVSALDDSRVRPVQLILDDLHEIAGTPAEQALERFLTLRPRKVRVLLGSRRPPRLNISRLLVSGELRQLDGEELRFRSWEVEELFRTVYDQPLSPEAAAALTRRTGGWAAGLQLFHLVTAGLTRPDRERAIEQLSGRSQLIRSYLARNVVAGLTPERRGFLLRTSALGVLTGDLCDALLDTSGSAALLAELELEQFFTTSSDGGLTYRYHQVLQTHLEVVLVDELGGAAARALYSRSGVLLEDSGRTAAAIRAHARAEDWGAVARLLKPDAPPVQDEALWGVLSLPGAPTDDPGLVLAGARRLLREGLVTESVAAYRQAETLLDDPRFRHRCAAERAAAAVWLPQPWPGEPGSAGPGAASAPLRLSSDLRRITVDLAEPEAYEHGLVCGLAQLLAGDLPAALRTLRTTVPDPASPGCAGLALQLASHLVEVIEHPDRRGAGQFEVIELGADLEGWPWIARLARGLQAALLLGTDPTPWRVSACADLLYDLERQRDPWTLCLTSLAVGYAFAATGLDAEADAPLARAEGVAVELGAPVLQAWAMSLRVSLDVRRGVRRHSDETASRARVAGLGLRWPPDRLPGPAARITSSTVVDSTSADQTIAPATPVRLVCLGGFSLRVAGVELGWRKLRPRVRALLMRLALQHGRRIHREQLVDDLWPDADLSSGVRSLQVAVSAARHCLATAGLGDDCLRRHDNAYALTLPGVDDQLAAFEDLLRRGGRELSAGRLDRALSAHLSALELYTGDLLPEVGPVEWVVGERERLRLLAASTGAEAAREALELGDYTAGVRAARRSVDLDPYHDSSWTLLVELCQRLGDHSAAAVARHGHARVQADLGLVLAGASATPTIEIPARPSDKSRRTS